MDLIAKDKLKWIAGKEGFNLIYLEKDYFLTLLFSQIKDIKNIYLKGGTALNKIFLNHKRLSEDLDFSCGRNVMDILAEIKNIIQNKNAFTTMKEVSSMDGFVRAKVFYKSYFQNQASVILDLNERATIHLKPEERKVPNFYGFNFKIKTINIEELVAEKIRALITRNQPRDYFDVYFILEKYNINWELVKTKVKEADEEYNKERIFKNAQKVYSRWDEDLSPLVREKLEFIKCIGKLKEKLK